MVCYVPYHKSTPSPSLSIQWCCHRHIVVSPYHHAYVPSARSVIFCDTPGPLSSYQIWSHNNLFMAHHSSTWFHCPCVTIHMHSQTQQSTELAPHGYFTSPNVCFILPCVFFYLISSAYQLTSTASTSPFNPADHQKLIRKLPPAKPSTSKPQTPTPDPFLSPATLTFAKQLNWDHSDKKPEDEMTSHTPK